MESIALKFLPIILSSIALGFSIFQFWLMRRRTAYTNFDTCYNSLLRDALKDPDFRNAEYTKDYKNKFKPEDVWRYEIYAFMCLNFCETIWDQSDSRIFRTWKCIVELELELHRNWLDHGGKTTNENHAKFKKEFTDRAFLQHPVNIG